jgi:outer membrane biogenesis lipoprotein LolB
MNVKANMHFLARERLLAFLWMGAACAVLLVMACAPQEKMEAANPEQLWASFVRQYLPAEYFEGEGQIYLKQKNGRKTQLEFTCKARGDSLFRFCVLNPMGGIFLTLRLNGEEYELSQQNIDWPEKGKYSDTLLTPLMNAAIPLELLRSLLTARPFIPSTEFNSMQYAKGGEWVYTVIDGPRRWMLQTNAKKTLPEALLMMRENKAMGNVYWKGYKQGRAYDALLRFANGTEIRIQFKKTSTQGLAGNSRNF